MVWLIAFISLLTAILMLAFYRRTHPRLLTAVLGIVLLLYVTVIVVPFFAYGLHLEDPTSVIRGGFDPKGYPLFDGSTPFGGWLHLLALLVIPLTPIAIATVGVRLIIKLRQNWQHLPSAQRVLPASILLFSLMVFAFMWTPLGRVISVWHFD